MNFKPQKKAKEINGKTLFKGVIYLHEVVDAVVNYNPAFSRANRFVQVYMKMILLMAVTALFKGVYNSIFLNNYL